jgi:tyrosine-protein kinase
MKNSEESLENMLRVLRRRKIVFLVALISVPLAAFLVSASKTKQYTASASLLFESKTEGLEATREAATNEALATLPEVAARAARELGQDVGIGEVLGSVEVSSANEMANIATISASNESPQRAAEIANAYSRAYIAFRRESEQEKVRKSIAIIEARLAEIPPSEAAGSKAELLHEQLAKLEVEEALQTGHTSLVQEAGPPSSPSSPRTSRNVLIGLIVGLIFGLGLVALIERLDRHARSEEELEELFGLPIIARIPGAKAFKDTGAKTMLGAPEAEAFRTLRANLRYLNIDRDWTSLLIASPEPSDGKSTVARGLSAAMAEMGDNVVLVEADLRKESAFRREPGYVAEGLSGVLAGRSLDEALMQVPVSNSDPGGERVMTVLPSGPIPPNPPELLESEQMKEILAVLGERFDMTIIDSPAIGAISDAMALMPTASAVLAIGGVGRTTRTGAKEFVDQVALSGSQPVGLIVTFASVRRTHYYYRPSKTLLRG